MDKILIVDDEPRHRRGLVDMLSTLRPEYEIAEAKNGQEALGIVSDPSVKIVITDVKMPVLDGLAFLQALDGKVKDIKVIILSGYAYFEYAQNALRLGAFDFVLKPVNKAKVDEMLKKAERKIAEETQAHLERQKIINRLDALLPAYQDRQLNRWVNCGLSQAEVEELTSLLMLSGRGTVVAVEIDQYMKIAENRDELGASVMENRLKDGLLSALGPHFKAVSFFQQGRPDLMLSIVTAPGGEMEEAALDEALQRFVSGIRKSFGVSLTAGVGGICEIVTMNVQSCCSQAVAAIETRKAAHQESRDTGIISKCKAYIDAHYADDLSLELLADHFSFNTSYFSSFFKNNTGENFTDYLLKVRMKKAVELLKESDLRVYEIAGKAGYRNEKYFYRVFKKEFGVAPEEFRRNSAAL